METRRDLAFERLDDVMPEVERLLDGHATSKLWTLGQILHHLAQAIRLSVEPVRGPQVRPSELEQARIFDVRRRLFFRAGRFPEDFQIPHVSMLPPLDADARAEGESLRHALRLLDESGGPFSDHPVLGPLTKEEWKTFHRLHCAHHLSFARPTSLPSGVQGATLAGETSREAGRDPIP